MEKGGLVSKVTIETGSSVLSSVITAGAVETIEKLDVKPEDKIYAVIKSTEVIDCKNS